MDLKVEYTSILAQANKALNAGAIERAIAFTGSLAQSFPEAADLLDVDVATREFFNATGAPPTMIRDEKLVQQIREARAQAAAQQQQVAQLAQVAEGAKLLSETNMSGDTALTELSAQL